MSGVKPYATIDQVQLMLMGMQQGQDREMELRMKELATVTTEQVFNCWQKLGGGGEGHKSAEVTMLPRAQPVTTASLIDLSPDTGTKAKPRVTNEKRGNYQVVREPRSHTTQVRRARQD